MIIEEALKMSKKINSTMNNLIEVKIDSKNLESRNINNLVETETNSEDLQYKYLKEEIKEYWKSLYP